VSLCTRRVRRAVKVTAQGVAASLALLRLQARTRRLHEQSTLSARTWLRRFDSWLGSDAQPGRRRFGPCTAETVPPSAGSPGQQRRVKARPRHRIHVWAALCRAVPSRRVRIAPTSESMTGGGRGKQKLTDEDEIMSLPQLRRPEHKDASNGRQYPFGPRRRPSDCAQASRALRQEEVGGRGAKSCSTKTGSSISTYTLASFLDDASSPEQP